MREVVRTCAIADRHGCGNEGHTGLTVTAAPPDSFDYEMSDALMRAATREAYIAKAREQMTAWHAVLLVCSTAIFALAVARNGHWLWWLAGVPALLAVVIGGIWLVLIAIVSRSAPRRLERLPHRQVRVGLGPRVVFETANEHLEVAWSEVKAIRALPSFWVFVLHTGLELPVPRDKLSEAEVAALRHRVTAD
jgi:hypothetical protein